MQQSGGCGGVDGGEGEAEEEGGREGGGGVLLHSPDQVPPNAYTHVLTQAQMTIYTLTGR